MQYALVAAKSEAAAAQVALAEVVGWVDGGTVDGSEILEKPVVIGKYPMDFIGVSIHVRWLFGISEPPTV